MFTRRVDKCCNGGNQHKFRPRYTEVEVRTNLKEVKSIGPGSLRSLLIKQIYVGDVCEWCGDITNKQKDF